MELREHFAGLGRSQFLGDSWLCLRRFYLLRLDRHLLFRTLGLGIHILFGYKRSAKEGAALDDWAASGVDVVDCVAHIFINYKLRIVNWNEISNPSAPN